MYELESFLRVDPVVLLGSSSISCSGRLLGGILGDASESPLWVNGTQGTQEMDLLENILV